MDPDQRSVAIDYGMIVLSIVMLYVSYQMAKKHGTI